MGHFVSSTRKNSTHHISLNDGSEELFFNVVDLNVREDPTTPSTVQFTQGGGEYGDWEPQHSHIQQTDWQGGRGRYRFVDDQTSFFDSGFANTMVPGRVVPAPQFRWGEGYNFGDVVMPGAGRADVNDDVYYVPMIGNLRYDRPFTTTASNYTVMRAWMWVRKIGEPNGGLAFNIYADSAGEPTGASLGSGSIGTTDVFPAGTGEMPILVEFGDMGAGWAQSASTNYHFVVYNTSTSDDEFNHWEIGTGVGSADACLTSTDGGSTWVSTTIQPYFRLGPSEFPGTWVFFNMEGGLYAVGNRDDTTATKLFINGDRGIATTADANTINDTTKSWTTDIFNGAWVRITKGTGKGQYREITDTGATNIDVTPNFTITPDATSEYVIYSTDEWTEITPATDGIDAPVKSVAVFDNQAVLAFGSGQALLRLRWNSGTPGHDGRDNSAGDTADVVAVHYDPIEGAQIWRAENDTVDISWSSVKAWGTDLSFNTVIPIGDDSWNINNLVSHNEELYVIKEDSLYVLRNGKARRVALGFDSMAQGSNGIAAISWKLMLYMNWAHSIEQVFSGNVLDMGPWQYAGMPQGRTGVVSALEGVHAFMLAAVNGEVDNYSSVLAWNERGYHELFRSWYVGNASPSTANDQGREIRALKWQACPGTRPRLWFECGGDILVMEFPKFTLNPLNDSTFVYNHFAYVTQGDIDMNALAIPKLFKELTIASENLTQGIEIKVQYQLDNDIGGTNWWDVGDFSYSPFQEKLIGQGNRRRIRLRYLMTTEDSDTPPVMLAPILEGFARTPTKYQWVVDIPTADMAFAGKNRTWDADDVVAFLKKNAESAQELSMNCIFKSMDDIRVIIEPPITDRQWVDEKDGSWGGVIRVAIREA